MRDVWSALVNWFYQRLHRKRSNDGITVIASNSIVIITIHKD